LIYTSPLLLQEYITRKNDSVVANTLPEATLELFNETHAFMRKFRPHQVFPKGTPLSEFTPAEMTLDQMIKLDEEGKLDFIHELYEEKLEDGKIKLPGCKAAHCKKVHDGKWKCTNNCDIERDMAVTSLAVVMFFIELWKAVQGNIKLKLGRYFTFTRRGFKRTSLEDQALRAKMCAYDFHRTGGSIAEDFLQGILVIFMMMACYMQANPLAAIVLTVTVGLTHIARVYRMLYITSRPFPEGPNQVEIWVALITWVSHIGIMLNSLFCVLSCEPFKSMSSTGRVVSFVTFRELGLWFNHFIRMAVPDDRDDVQAIQKRDVSVERCLRAMKRPIEA